MYNTCITHARISGSFLYLFQYKNITQTSIRREPGNERLKVKTAVKRVYCRGRPVCLPVVCCLFRGYRAGEPRPYILLAVGEHTRKKLPNTAPVGAGSSRPVTLLLFSC